MLEILENLHPFSLGCRTIDIGSREEQSCVRKTTESLLNYPESMSEGKGDLARFLSSRKPSVMQKHQEERHKSESLQTLPTAFPNHTHRTLSTLSQDADHYSLQDSLLYLFVFGLCSFLPQLSLTLSLVSIQGESPRFHEAQWEQQRKHCYLQTKVWKELFPNQTSILQERRKEPLPDFSPWTLYNTKLKHFS